MVHIRTDENGFPILNERDYQYNKLAYERMTPEQIKMSEQREYEVQSAERWKFIRDLRRFEAASRKVIIRVN